MDNPFLLDISRALIRLDTSNPGSTEEQAALYVTDLLDRVGIANEYFEPAPGRVSVVSRTPGSDSSLPPLVLHAHLDTVPVQADGWSHDPFGAEIVGGELWGRGAVDMKVAVAMLLRLQLECGTGGPRPRRDLIVAYLADEEMGGTLGSRWIVEHRADLFAGAENALGEIGGFNIDLPNGRRVFYVQAAERGMLWLRVVIKGPGGHAAFSANPNPLVSAARFISSLSEVGVDENVLVTTSELEHRLESLLGGDGLAPLSARSAELGGAAPLVLRGRRTQFVPTVITGGEKLNMIPGAVEVFVDCRFLPGSRDAAFDVVGALLPEGAHIEVVAETSGLQSPTDGATFDALRSTIERFHPEATVLPFVFPGGSDNQKFAHLGIRGYGFMPLVLPPGYPYLEMFHAVDERLPVDAIPPGFAMLKDFVLRY